MTIKRKSRKILSDYQLTSAYKETLAYVVEPLVNEYNQDFLINRFNDLYQKNWVDLFKFNTDRKLYSDEQENLNKLVYVDLNKIMKHIWNPHTNWDNCPFTGNAS